MVDRTTYAPGSTTARATQRCISGTCDAVYDLAERIHVCAKCGEPLEVELNRDQIAKLAASPIVLRELWKSRAGSTLLWDRSGVWRHRELLPFEESSPIVTLFEGNTPLYDAPRCAEYAGLQELRLKHQGCNPTGSFKDTGMTVALTHAVVTGARTTVCASTGNTAASLAAYSARARLQCLILVPHGQVTAAKLAQSVDYGAVVCEIDGNFDDCMRLAKDLDADKSIYLANSINPFRVEGQKTVAFELMEQCEWRVPGHIVVPGGNLGNSTALGKGFKELRELGLIDRVPRINVVQAEGSAPFAHLFAELKRNKRDEIVIPAAITPEKNPRTLATAIKIGAPVSWKKALREVLRTGGEVISVSEQEIADAKAVIGREGIGCEPASATTVAGIRKLVASGHIRSGDAVVAVLTGHVLKDPEYVSNYHCGTLSHPSGSAGQHDNRQITGLLRNATERIPANKSAVLEVLHRRF